MIDPDRQFSLSYVFLPRPLIFIPVPSGTFHIFTAYGQERKFLAEVHPDNLTRWLEEDFQLSLTHKAVPPSNRQALDVASILEGISL